MKTTPAQRAQWRAEAKGAMISAVWEYCPDEFTALLDDIEELERRLADGPAVLLPTWYCGCGHTNGVNLALCAACGRNPNGVHPG